MLKINVPAGSLKESLIVDMLKKLKVDFESLNEDSVWSAKAIIDAMAEKLKGGAGVQAGQERAAAFRHVQEDPEGAAKWGMELLKIPPGMRSKVEQVLKDYIKDIKAAKK